MSVNVMTNYDDKDDKEEGIDTACYYQEKTICKYYIPARNDCKHNYICIYNVGGDNDIPENNRCPICDTILKPSSKKLHISCLKCNLTFRKKRSYQIHEYDLTTHQTTLNIFL